MKKSHKRIIFMFAMLLLCWVVTLLPSAEEQGSYVCPPCGSSCDHQSFDKPGACPVCGMTLVAKAKGNAPMNSSNPEQTRRPMKQSTIAQGKRVAIFIFEGVQIIDYTGPYEVFGQAGFNVFTVAENSSAITTAMGMSVNPQYTFANHPKPDILVLPGGDVPTHQDKPAVIHWIQENAKQAEVVLSVCNGAFFLARAGLLDGLESTTFASLIDGLQTAAPKTKVVYNRRFVDNGKIITSAGLSSGIDGSIHVVEKLLGKGWAQVVATGLEYNWDPESKYVRASLADRYLRDVYDFMQTYDREVLSHQGNTKSWSTSWKVQSSQTGSALLDQLHQKLATVENWTSRNSGGNTETTWNFKSPDKQNWSGKATVKTATEPGTFVLTVSVAQAGM